MPDLIPPMQVSAGSGQPPVGPEWVVELAWTGHRCVAYVDPEREAGKRTRLLSANDVSMTATYPELGQPLERHSPPGGMILDGTIVARGEEHAPRARRLARRSGRFRPTESDIRDVPVDFQIADLLWLDGHSTVELPYRDRRGLLEGLGFDTAPIWSTSPLPVSEMESMLAIADAKGVDALHARHLGSRYRPGGRSPLWVKVPVPRVRQVVIGGWTPTDMGRPDTIASLLLGVPDGHGGLRYVGRVGVTGDHRRRMAVLPQLRCLLSPFSGEVPAEASRYAVWVEPQLVGLVEFTGFSSGGRLRLPHWQGLADPDDVDLRDADGTRWARPPEPVRAESDPHPTLPQATGPDRAPLEATRPGLPDFDAPDPSGPTPQPAPEPGPERVTVTTSSGPVETGRRLEQHFVYNSLNTIASLIRTDPIRARELLFGFADLSRAADQPDDATIPLGNELDAVRGYLQLEQARFGKRLRVELDIADALHAYPVQPMRLLGPVRDAVQRDIEPLPEGGVVRVYGVVRDDGCGEVGVVATGGAPVVFTLPAAVAP